MGPFFSKSDLLVDFKVVNRGELALFRFSRSHSRFSPKFQLNWTVNKWDSKIPLNGHSSKTRGLSFVIPTLLDAGLLYYVWRPVLLHTPIAWPDVCAHIVGKGTIGVILDVRSEMTHVCCVRLRTAVIPHFLIFPPVRGQSSHCRSKTYSWRVVVYYTRRLNWNDTLYAVYYWGRLSDHSFLYLHQCEDSPRIAAQKRTADVW